MKVSSLLIVLLLLIPAGNVRAGTSRESSPVVSWPEGSVVRVYFVQSGFTAAEREMLWKAIETWTQRSRQKGLQISFVLAGETGGLIDCVGCLTIARQGFAMRGARQRVSFNALRQNNLGRLMSAWIGFERATTTETELRTLMLQALDRGFAISGSQTAKGIRR